MYKREGHGIKGQPFAGPSDKKIHLLTSMSMLIGRVKHTENAINLLYSNVCLVLIEVLFEMMTSKKYIWVKMPEK